MQLCLSFYLLLPFLCRLSQVWWTADGAVWTCATSAAAFPARYNLVLLVFSGQMWLVGGYGGTDLNDVWASTDGVQWVAQAPLPSSLSSFAAVVLGSSILTTGCVSTEFKNIGVSQVPLPAS